MKEIWKDVPLFEGLYKVSNTGKVISYKKSNKGILIGVKPDKDGYHRIQLRKNNIIYMTSTHRLVAQLYIPNHVNKPCVNHKDYNKSNNHVNNLEWVTDQENSQYSKNNLFFNSKRYGESHPRSKFTNDQVKEMYLLRATGMKYSKIAKIYNAKQNTINAIFLRKYYNI